MKTIAFFTTSRAEFGYLSPLIEAVEKEQKLDYHLFVGGAHLAPEMGSTIQEVFGSSLRITHTFDFLLNSDSESALAKSMGIAMYELARIFETHPFDFVCVIGDRYELIAIVTCAILFKKPIIHIHGGERTEGVIDEQVRHMVTKAAHIHFPACDEYAQNIRLLGEEEWRIINTGSLTVDHMRKVKRLTKRQIFKVLERDPEKPTVLMTVHPESASAEVSADRQITRILEALDRYDFQVVVTAPGMDAHRDVIVSCIKHAGAKRSDFLYIESLGYRRYHSLLPHCAFVIGNSSSGIIEVPYYRIPTINIGDRQKGRVRHESVIDVKGSADGIVEAIELAISPDFKERLKDMVYKFGDGHAAPRIVEALKRIELSPDLFRKSLGS